jgi:hypothetical protein
MLWATQILSMRLQTTPPSKGPRPIGYQHGLMGFCCDGTSYETSDPSHYDAILPVTKLGHDRPAPRAYHTSTVVAGVAVYADISQAEISTAVSLPTVVACRTCLPACGVSSEAPLRTVPDSRR